MLVAYPEISGVGKKDVMENKWNVSYPQGLSGLGRVSTSWLLPNTTDSANHSEVVCKPILNVEVYY